jgi:osmoprotectant transport system permease protein
VIFSGNVRAIMAILFASLLSSCVFASQGSTLVLGAKSFTESAILGNMLRALAEDAGADAALRVFPGSSIAFQALLAGEIDAYPEYTGTIARELLSRENIATDADLRDALARRELAMSAPIGFNNAYAIGVTRETATRLGLRVISDLRAHPELRMAFSTEFMNRADGWPGLRDAYALRNSARGIEHSLAYGALESGAIDVTDLYATDAQIATMDLVVLSDDLGYFPRYDAVILYRTDLPDRHPEAFASMMRLVGAIDEPTMRALNERSELGADGMNRASPERVARDAAASLFGIEHPWRASTLRERIIARTIEHLGLVGISMTFAILIAIPLGILASKSTALAGPILATTGVLQTIPAIALLVLLIKPFGIGPPTAIIALFLYSLLPIVRNTHAGIATIPRDLIESSDAIGLGSLERLRRIELPLALPTIMAGVKTAVVINIGAATLGGFISAGGYGQPIFTGITQNDFAKILEGALPAAALAIAAQLAFDLVERVTVAKGLR